MIDRETDGIPCWLWPNIFALDAPLVAVIWQLSLMPWLGINLIPLVPWTLFFTVWCIYLGDRWLDTSPGRMIPDSDRHQFTANYRKLISGLMMLTFCVAGTMAFSSLPETYLTAGVLMMSVMLIYSFLAHWLFRYQFDGHGKELIVALLFVIGVTLPLWVEDFPPRWESMIVIFGLVMIAWLNCELISLWESKTPSAKRKWLFGIGLFAILLGWLSITKIGICFTMMIVAMFALDYFRDRLSLRLRRVLIDVALLAPILPRVLL